MQALAVASAIAFTAVLGGGGCKDKDKHKPAPAPALPDVAGMDAIPAAARVVVGIEVARLADSWLVERAVTQMFLREPGLQARMRGLLDACKIDPAESVERFIIGLGAGAQRDQAVMAIAGALAEADIASCVNSAVSADGRSLAVQQVGGRTFYSVAARGGPASGKVWFTFPAPRTMVVATSSAWLADAVGDGTKVGGDAEMARLLAHSDQTADIWIAGEVAPEIGAGLVDLTDGDVGQAPRAMYGSVNVRAGLSVELGVVMNSPSDANRLKRLAKSQLALGANILQGAGLGTLVSKLELEVKGDVLMLAVAVSDDELKQVLSRIDMSAPAEQNPTSPTEPGKPDAAGQPAAVPADQSPADGGAKAPTSDAQPADTQASSQER